MINLPEEIVKIDHALINAGIVTRDNIMVERFETAYCFYLTVSRFDSILQGVIKAYVMRYGLIPGMFAYMPVIITGLPFLKVSVFVAFPEEAK